MGMAKKDTIRGRVVSDKMDKTVVVAVEKVRRHPLYKKPVRRVKKYMVHDEANAFHVGDWVDIMATRPLSSRKRWCVVSPVSRDTAEPLPSQEGEQ